MTQVQILRRLFVIALAVALLLITQLQGWDLLDLHALGGFVDELKVRIQHEPFWTSALLFGVYFLLAALSIPGTGALTLVAGALLPIVPAVLGSLASASIGAIVAFLAARLLFQEKVPARWQTVVDRLESGLKFYGRGYAVAVRMIPVIPFGVVNWSLGLTNIPTRDYVSSTVIGLLPVTVLYVLAGREIKSLTNWSDITQSKFLWILAALGGLPFVMRLLHRLRRRHA